MRDDLRDWRARGINVALIGNGTVGFAEAFREDFDLEGPVLVDPDLHAYRAARLRRGAAAVASPRVFRDTARALRSGARQDGVQGDAWQLGGVFVIAEGGELRYAFRSTTAGEHAPAKKIAAALAKNAPTIDEGLGEAPDFYSGPLATAAQLLRPILDVSPVLSFDRIGFERHALGFDPADLDVDLYGQRCLVTGANSGLGYATALALADLGAEVVLLCRNAERGNEAVSKIRETTGNRRVALCRVDISDFADIERVVPELTREPIDVLVHNAGVLPEKRAETAAGLELCFATHVAGPHLLTARLREALEAAGEARIIWVSSGGMLARGLNVDDPNWIDREYDGVAAYAETKRAQVVLSELWAEEFAGTMVAVNSMHPGWADTPSVQASLPLFHKVTEAILRSPEQGADTIVWLAASTSAQGETGSFFFDREAVRTHWLPTTHESEVERETLWAMLGGANADMQDVY